MTLEDSTTYQLILNKGIKQGEVWGEARGEARGEVRGEAKGRVAEAHGIVLLLGGQRFGAAPAEVESALRAISDHPRLERMAARLLTATDWNDLLATT